MVLCFDPTVAGFGAGAKESALFPNLSGLRYGSSATAMWSIEANQQQSLNVARAELPATRIRSAYAASSIADRNQK
jgi:hypothetical protein